MPTATSWPAQPRILEIPVWPWLADLAHLHARPVSLDSVPAQAWDHLADLGIDAVWLMGVWERSPAGRAISLQNHGLVASFRNALPDYQAADNVGSPYCIRRYVVDSNLGGPSALAVARRELRQRGIRLLLDFVPNHVAPDHPWVTEHPDFLLRPGNDLRMEAEAVLTVGDHTFARGRDPYFPPWQDVLQLDAFSLPGRRAAAEVLRQIAHQCDGVRCDMAMLVLNQVFARTWPDRFRPAPATEYWTDLMETVRPHAPDFLWIAEAYWGLESELLRLGFDGVYDKTLYDLLRSPNPAALRQHLAQPVEIQARFVRFTENHDEERAATAFRPGHLEAATVAAWTLPGARLLHDGQLEGRRTRLPVFLGRRPSEPVHSELARFHRSLLAALHDRAFHRGQWQVCPIHGWPDNSTHQHLLAWTWRHESRRDLVVINLSAVRSQGRISVPWDDLDGRPWRLRDPLTADDYRRDGSEMCAPGLFVDLEAFGFHLFRVEPAT